MIVTAEVSLYPLKDTFEPAIITFIKSLNSIDDIEVYTHSMSTYVIGESSHVFDALRTAFESIAGSVDTSSLVIKMVNRKLPVEKGFLEF